MPALKNHPLFKNAKYESDFNAAQKVVKDRLSASLPLQVNRNESFIIVPVIKQNKINQLPLAFAHAIKQRYPGATVDNNIVLDSSVSRKKFDACERLLFRPVFQGKVIPNAKYLVCDDVLTHGATLNELKRFIEKKGGEVLDATVLASPPYNFNKESDNSWCARFCLSEKEIRSCLDRFSPQLIDVLKHFSIANELSDLTFSEMKYLNMFCSIDTFKVKLKDVLADPQFRELFASTYPDKFLKIKSSPNIDQKGYQTSLDFGAPL